jgi:hypothetical protein
MHNRRNDYRHPFAPEDRLRVELTSARGSCVIGEIADLSIGGLAYEGDVAFPLVPDEQVTAHFAIPHGLRRFAIPATVVHDRGDRFGLHFLPLEDDEAQEDRDKALWVFLLDEQRRERRRLRGERAG